MTKKRMRRAVLVLALLICAFFLTSFCLAAANVTVSLGNHIFATEYMEIGIKGNVKNGAELQFFAPDGKNPITLIEPGMTLTGDFTVRNDSTFDVYYRLRFTDVTGELADVLVATITTQDGTVLCGPCTVKELESVDQFAPKVLGEGQQLALRLTLQFPASAGNDAQGKALACRLTADMTQVRNNEDMVFDLP